MQIKARTNFDENKFIVVMTMTTENRRILVDELKAVTKMTTSKTQCTCKAI